MKTNYYSVREKDGELTSNIIVSFKDKDRAEENVKILNEAGGNYIIVPSEITLLTMSKSPSTEKTTMPFTGHEPSELVSTLKFINECGLSIEALDAFLAEYAKTKDLGKSIWFAQCEWDL